MMGISVSGQPLGLPHCCRPFSSLLLSISDRLTGEDLEKMKFCLQLPEGKLEDIQRPFEVFRRMINVQSLSADNPGRLASLLESAGRIDLSKELLQYVCKLKSANEGKFQFYQIKE